MSDIVRSIEVARLPTDIFSYATDFSRFPEWQGGVVSVRVVGDGRPGVGTIAIVTRQVGRRQMPRSETLIQLHPPRTWTVRGEGGAVVTTTEGSIEPLDQGERARVTIALSFEGRGVGRLLVPLVIRRQAATQLPKNEQRLKEMLEGGAQTPSAI
jgi:carbon monoxide dehydrogenase subunit G